MRCTWSSRALRLVPCVDICVVVVVGLLCVSCIVCDNCREGVQAPARGLIGAPSAYPPPYNNWGCGITRLSTSNSLWKGGRDQRMRVHILPLCVHCSLFVCHTWVGEHVHQLCFYAAFPRNQIYANTCGGGYTEQLAHRIHCQHS